MKNILRFRWLLVLAFLFTISQVLALRPLWAAYQTLPTHLPSPEHPSPVLLLSLVVAAHLGFGAMVVFAFRRSLQPRHWHPRVGLLSHVQVLPSGELSQVVSSRIQPYVHQEANPRVG